MLPSSQTTSNNSFDALGCIEAWSSCSCAARAPVALTRAPRFTHMSRQALRPDRMSSIAKEPNIAKRWRYNSTYPYLLYPWAIARISLTYHRGTGVSKGGRHYGYGQWHGQAGDEPAQIPRWRGRAGRH